jgi:hypothetical protein
MSLRNLLLPLCVAFPFILSAASSVEAATVTAVTNAEIRLIDGGSTDDDSGIRVFNGDRSTLFFNIQGGDDGFATFGVADFTFAADPFAIDVFDTSLSLFEDPAGFGSAGDIQVFLLNDTSESLIDPASNPAGAPAYQTGQNGFAAIDPVFNPSSTALGGATFTPTAAGTETNVSLNFSGADKTALLSAVQTGGTIRLGVVSDAGTPGVTATFAGQSNSDGAAPTFNFAVTAIPEPSSVLALGALSCGIVLRRRRKA